MDPQQTVERLIQALQDLPVRLAGLRQAVTGQAGARPAGQGPGGPQPGPDPGPPDWQQQMLTLLAQMNQFLAQISQDGQRGRGTQGTGTHVPPPLPEPSIVFGVPPTPQAEPAPQTASRATWGQHLGALFGVTQTARTPQERERQRVEDRERRREAFPGFVNRMETGLMSGAQGRVGSMFQVMGGFSSALSALPGPLGKAAAGFTKMFDVVGKTVERLQAFSDKTHQINMQYATYSGAMAGVAARQRVLDIQHQQRMGAALAPGAQRLVDARERTRRAFEPTQIAFQNFNNFLSTRLIAPLLTGIGTLTSAVTTSGGNVVRLLRGEPLQNPLNPNRNVGGGVEQIDWNEFRWMREEAVRQFPELWGQPPRFRNPGQGGQ